MKHTLKIIFGILIIVQIALSVMLYLSISDTLPRPQRRYRILACISSFKRPVFVSGQVLRMMNQSYPVDVSLSIKGVPEFFVKTALKSEWRPFIDSGRLKLRIDPNRDQLSNFLDTVRGIDLSKYDFFCKIDDDDWYGPDYFKHVNEWLNKTSNIGISLSTRAYVIRDGKKEVRVFKNNSLLSGPSMCFSRKTIEAALEIEKNPAAQKKYLPRVSVEHFKQRREDNYMNQLGKSIGKEQRRITPFTDLSFGQQYPSVMRGNYLP